MLYDKFISPISERKWGVYSTEKKIKFFELFFFRIERLISAESYHDVNLKDLQIYVDLCKNETDDTLIKIYNILLKSLNMVLDEGGIIKDVLLALLEGLKPLFYNTMIAQKDFHFLDGVKVKKEGDILPIVLILDNLRSAFNVGSIIRTAECLSVEEVWCCGYTPLPDNPKVVNTAMGTQDRIKWKSFACTKEAVMLAKAEGYMVYALETVEGAVSVFENEFSEKSAIVLGNEALGISEDVVEMCDKCIVLPMSGWKNSLNVATACAVVCFEVYRRLKCQNCQK